MRCPSVVPIQHVMHSCECSRPISTACAGRLPVWDTHSRPPPHACTPCSCPWTIQPTTCRLQSSKNSGTSASSSSSYSSRSSYRLLAVLRRDSVGSARMHASVTSLSSGGIGRCMDLSSTAGRRLSSSDLSAACRVSLILSPARDALLCLVNSSRKL